MGKECTKIKNCGHFKFTFLDLKYVLQNFEYMIHGAYVHVVETV